MILFYAALALFLAGGFFLAARHVRVLLRKRHFLDSAFPEKWEQIIRRNVPAAEKLPAHLRERFRFCVKNFLLKKTFEPCGNLKEISDEIAVTVAGNASLLACGSDDEAWKILHTVLIYPSAFAGTLRHRSGKIVTETAELNDGESWGAERVALSWERIRHDIALCGNAQNVIIHEFAHQFDATVFAAAPFSLRERWAKIAKNEMTRIKNGDPSTIIDEYGADDPVEFFAVATEAFFETPAKLQAAHPKTYSTLKEIYKLSPAEW